jgi:hypothetical protein
MFKKLSAKSIIALGVSGLAVAMLAGSVALSASSANVTATVTVPNISLSVSDGSVAYGTLAVSTSADTCSSHLNDLQTVTNDGNIAEDINIKGVDTANWTLAGTAGSDAYVHKFANATCTTSFPTGTALTTSDQQLASNIASSGTTPLNLQITTPTTSSVYTQQSPNVTLTAVAH